MPTCQAVNSPIIFHVLIMTNPESQVTVGTFPMVSMFWGQSKLGKLLSVLMFLVPVICPLHRAVEHRWRRPAAATHVETCTTGQALYQVPAWHKTSLQDSPHTEKSESWKTQAIFLGITHPTNAGTTIQKS